MRFRLVGGQPNRSAPHACGTECHCSRHLPASPDPPGAYHRHRGHGIDDLGDQHHGCNLTGVASRLVTLCDDQVHAGIHMSFGVSSGAEQLATYFVGQIVGSMSRSRPAGQIVMDMVEEFIDSCESLAKQLGI